MNVLLYHISVILDIIFFGLGVISVLLIRKNPSQHIRLLLDLAKVFAGASIFLMLFFSISPKMIIGTGLDLALSYIAGVLITSGILRIETDLI